MTELKPCPFCGGKAEKTVVHSRFSTTRVCFECANCRSGGSCFLVNEDYCATDKAAEAWNTRVEPKED